MPQPATAEGARQAAAATLERAAATLLAATEALHAALRSPDATDLAGLTAAYDRRCEAFDALRAAVEAGAEPGPAARACLQRVNALDAELLELGGARVDAVRGEQAALRRRRSVIRAHAARERPDARVIAVKA